MSGFTQRKATFFKVATGTEPDSYTWTWSGAQAAAGGIAAYANVDQTAPIAAHSGAASATNGSTSIRGPSVTTTEDGAMILGFYSMAQNATVAPPPGTTERFDVVSNLGTYPIVSEGTDEPQATAGATGDRFATASRTGWSIGQLIALRRAPA
jgi:MSHA biogenesis protein MshQ